MIKPSKKIPIEESPWVDKQSVEDIANFADNFAKTGIYIADLIEHADSKGFGSFQTGAIQNMEDLNSATRNHKISRTSTFRFSDQKNAGEDVTIILIMDNSKMAAQEKVFSLTTACMLKEWIRHPNKSKPVTLFLNEINNYTFKGLVGLFSYSRKYNIRLNLYLQNLTAFTKRYGEKAKNALLSEATIKLFLPKGQNAPDMLEMLEKSLGRQSVMVKGNSGKRKGEAGLDGYTYSEEARPLMYGSEIREMSDRGILFIGNKKPVRVYLPTIASIAPFRRWQGINPFYNKPYLERVKLRIWRYYPWMPANLWQKLKRRIKTVRSKSETNT